MISLLCDRRAARARITVVPAQHSWVALPDPFVSSLQGMDVQRPLVIRLTVTSASGERDLATLQRFSSRAAVLLVPASLCCLKVAGTQL
jgi:hypothetical protein